MEPKNYDKEILREWQYKRICNSWMDSPKYDWAEMRRKYKNAELKRHFPHFTDGFFGAMALIGMGVVGYHLIRFLLGLIKQNI